MIKKIEHIGIAVHSLERALPFYIDVLKLKLLGIEEVELQQVKVAFLAIGESKLELLEPLSQESSIARFIQKNGEGIHHIALGTTSIEERIQHMKEYGVRMIDEVPQIGAKGARIAFVHPKSSHGTLYELCDKGGRI
ncbi:MULTISPECIES: methylmalonyl-CoA epimerase [unclassified Bacillus (in: firmicutes)]|uniref:methylmalonyl-CoA epimerase n=1 Tax=unclassified Bacillus (in: firmicutes) TaxID=185979 RepID=UPI00232F684C|nr:methylmalonyl-CoA epimerase [Bacillus sp. BP-3]MDC2865498.1 methylmalonyl-CoA epimerase [Bacillus sp. BP-3]